MRQLRVAPPLAIAAELPPLGAADAPGALAGAPRYKHVLVVDLAGFAMRTHLGGQIRRVLPELVGWLSNYYPETTVKKYFVNAPAAMRWIRAAVAPMISRAQLLQERFRRRLSAKQLANAQRRYNNKDTETQRRW